MTAPTNPTEAMVDAANEAGKTPENPPAAPTEPVETNDPNSELEKLKADLAAKESALAKANDERTRLNKRKKELEDQLKGESNTPDLTEALSPWKSALVKTQLTAKGLTPEAAEIISRLIKLEDIDITDEGIAGLSQIDDLEKTMPQLFAKPEAPKDEPKPGATPATNRPIETGNPQDTTPSSALSDASKLMLKGLRG